MTPDFFRGLRKVWVSVSAPYLLSFRITEKKGGPQCMKSKLRLDRLTDRLFIYQNPEGFCFGTDAVLLAWFCRRKKASRPVDLCSGNGVIPLLLSEGSYPAIYGVELLSVQAALADQSIAYNRLSGRVFMIQGDLREIGTRFDGGFSPLTSGGFDLVTANPPYSPSGQGEEASGSRGVARCEKTCTLEDVSRAAGFLLGHGGRFCLINRADRTAEIFAAMRACLIEPKVLLPVISKPGRGVSLVLVEGKKGARPGLVFEEPLFLYGADGSVSETVRQIYGNCRENVVL